MRRTHPYEANAIPSRPRVAGLARTTLLAGLVLFVLPVLVCSRSDSGAQDRNVRPTRAGQAAAGPDTASATFGPPPTTAGPVDRSQTAVAGVSTGLPTDPKSLDALAVLTGHATGPGSIRGLVTDGVTGAPLSGIGVWLRKAFDGTYSRSTSTDADGTYRIADVAPGSYRMSYEDPAGRYRKSYYPGVDMSAGASSFAVGTDALTGDVAMFTSIDRPLSPYDGAATGRRIAVFGDSLIDQATVAINGKVSALGAVSVRGIPSVRADQVEVVAQRFADGGPSDVVIALGNNDVNQAWPLDQSVAALRDLIGRFPDAACIQVVNVNARTARADFNDRARILDAALATEVAGHPGVHLVDWAGHIEDPARAQASRTWFTDGVHLTEAGINEYATVIADGLSACPDH